MCASQAAPFLLQRDSFSCRNAHAFNRLSSLQVMFCVCCTRFPLVSCEFSRIVSLLFLSSHVHQVLVLLRSIGTIQPAFVTVLPKVFKQNWTANEDCLPVN